jgi:hypothetical protein
MFPPPFREVVWYTQFGRATWLNSLLSASSGQLVFQQPPSTTHCFTVAGQRRTCTGFAFKPSHPGEWAPELLSLRFSQPGCLTAILGFSYFMPGGIERQAFCAGF